MSNRFLFTLTNTGKTINIPIEMKWDFDGKDDSIEIYENDSADVVPFLVRLDAIRYDFKRLYY